MDQTAIQYHQEHREWLLQLDFYQDQIKTFQNELMLVMQKHADLFNIIEHVEEYRAIFMKKLQRLDNLRHQIMLHEWQIARQYPTDEPMHTAHVATAADLEQFIRDFEHLRNNFRRFAAYND
ncbi:MAG TPA: hypothetical protein PKD70_06020 [Saprospiraceae bacterium]|nr:hypothetical protein [Saprospiraceae bacterium]